jgi:hypothetical protein
LFKYDCSKINKFDYFITHTHLIVNHVLDHPHKLSPNSHTIDPCHILYSNKNKKYPSSKKSNNCCDQDDAINQKKKKFQRKFKNHTSQHFQLFFYDVPKALRCCILMPSTTPQSIITWTSPKVKKSISQILICYILKWPLLLRNI